MIQHQEKDLLSYLKKWKKKSKAMELLSSQLRHPHGTQHIIMARIRSSLEESLLAFQRYIYSYITFIPNFIYHLLLCFNVDIIPFSILQICCCLCSSGSGWFTWMINNVKRYQWCWTSPDNNKRLISQHHHVYL